MYPTTHTNNNNKITLKHPLKLFSITQKWHATVACSALWPHNVQSTEQEHLGRQKQNKTNKQNWNSTLFPFKTALYRDFFLSSYRRTRLRNSMLRITAYHIHISLCSVTAPHNCIPYKGQQQCPTKCLTPHHPPLETKIQSVLSNFSHSLFIYVNTCWAPHLKMNPKRFTVVTIALIPASVF